MGRTGKRQGEELYNWVCRLGQGVITNCGYIRPAQIGLIWQEKDARHNSMSYSVFEHKDEIYRIFIDQNSDWIIPGFKYDLRQYLLIS